MTPANAFRFLRALFGSLGAYLTISLATLILGPPCMALAIWRRWPGALMGPGIIVARVGLAFTGLRIRVAGLEHVADGAAVYCFNHISNMDPPVIFPVIFARNKGLRILFKAELSRLPILGPAFEVVGFVPVERGNKEQTMRAVERAIQALREGRSFMIAPEGTRSRTGEMLPFKKGGFIMAIKAQAPLVPVVVRGTREAMKKGSPLIWPVDVSVRIGAPIPTAGATLEQRDVLMLQVRRAMEQLLEEGPVGESARSVVEKGVGSRL